MPCTLLDLLSYLVAHFYIGHIGDYIECILVILYVRVKSRKIEAVSKVNFIDLAEVSVTTRRNELALIVSTF